MIVGSAAVHAALLAVLLTSGAAAPAVSDVGAISVSLFDGAAVAAAHADAPTQEAPAKSPASQTPTEPEPAPAVNEPDPPSEIDPQFLDIRFADAETIDRPAVDDPVALSVAASAALGTPCDLSQWLQKALQADPQVLQALTLIPRPARSVANAIMLWDGGWVATSPRAASGVAAIRQALLAGVLAAPPACRDQPVVGPEIFTLTDAQGTTVIVVGSGAWRWGDLLIAPLRADAARFTVRRALDAKP